MIIFSITNLYADELSDAIRASDLNKVKLMWEQQTLTEKQLIKYLDTAQEVIRFRRDNILLDRQYAEELQGWEQGWAILGWSSFGCFLISSIIINKNIVKNPEFENNLLAAVGAASMIGSLTSLIAVITIKERKTKEHYDNAITIKEMLYDLLENKPCAE